MTESTKPDCRYCSHFTDVFEGILAELQEIRLLLEGNGFCSSEEEDFYYVAPGTRVLQ